MDKKQIYFCVNCKTVDVVVHKVNADVFSVANMIGEAHKKQSPECDTPAAMVQSLNSAISDLPEWAQEKAVTLTANSPHDPI